MTIKIDGFSKKQSAIADIIWSCDSKEQVLALIDSLPRKDRIEAYVVMQMIIQATIDEHMETDLAQQVLARFRL
jgi:hypothetical protein